MPFETRQISFLITGRRKRLWLLARLSNAPSGQIERHQDFNANNSSPSNTGKSSSSKLGCLAEKSLLTAKRDPKNKPMGHTRQKTGNPNKNDDNNAPPKTAWRESNAQGGFLGWTSMDPFGSEKDDARGSIATWAFSSRVSLAEFTPLPLKMSRRRAMGQIQAQKNRPNTTTERRTNVMESHS
jgi:hypothetical protein